MHCPGHRSDFKVSPVTSYALPDALKKSNKIKQKKAQFNGLLNV